MRDTTGSTNYLYDGESRMLWASRPEGLVQYGYDPAGDMNHLQYPDGTGADYTYDRDDRLATVTSTSGTSTYSYDPAGNPISLRRPNSVIDTTTYDASGRETSARAARGATELPRSSLTNHTPRHPAAALRKHWNGDFDDAGAIGRRYRRQDEIGTPFCVTVDFDTLTDQAVTVRERDTMAQERVALDQVEGYLAARLPGC